MKAGATEQRSTRLNQIVAVRATVKGDSEKVLTRAYHLLQKQDLLRGLTRTYSPRNEDGFQYPGEDTNVQVSVEQAIREVSAQLTRLFDVTAAMDWTNQSAKADVVLLNSEQPVTLLSDVPVTYLMFLEKQLVNLETFVRRLPTLDPAEEWTFDPATDVYRSAPVKTVKTKKTPRNHVKAEATDKHAAQVEVYYEDLPEGTWSTVKFSGAYPAAKVNKLLGRITALVEAVKYARENANLTEVVNPNPGKRVFDYLFPADPA